MPSIGPQLPPHLSKRKRTPQDEDDGDSDSDDALTPSLPPPPSSKLPRREGAPPIANEDEAPAPAPARPAMGPSLPAPAANDDAIDLSDSEPVTKGPAPQPQPPPQKQQQQQQQQQQSSAASADSDSDSDSDSYGPSLPSVSAQCAPVIGPSLPTTHDAAPKRDSWMLAPPPAGGGYSERDPTRIRARKFASKPSGAAPAPNAPSVWTETPEEKLRRLQNAVLGRSDPEADVAANNKSSGAKSERDVERDRKIAASIEAQRGSSLYDEHSQKRRNGGVQKGDEDDDPSQRPFDRDKDLALGGKIGTAKRRELVTRAANFGGRFQKGSYL
ncbi:uncharacterized protein HRG_06570 [Hirsutella rhossiliensis]|uniref:DUF3752 domain-containing protein n=1 Tax=Hirsutella rhossiliensis TaxID=111463 RepID=A0A9P8MUM5_9HYPO|nr:uncharacterized protein HRG_06570 [Hirsutella rhossiliensis]KAH0962468.1 hypothetical protein HRG_06570 [Hirsutella rhossiliensis]